MSYRELLKARFQVGLREEQQEARRRITDLDRLHESKGMYGNGSHHADGATIYIEGIERLMAGLVKELRQESMHLAPRAFAELWETVETFLGEQIGSEFNRRRLTLKSKFEQRGVWHSSVDMAMGQMFNQRASDLRVDLHYRVEEAKHSYNLLTVPSRPPTMELLDLVKDVKALLANQGSLVDFLGQNAPKLERIESEIRRVGLDVEFAADVLTQQLGDKLTNKGVISQFLSGVATNGGYDVIKTALGAFLGLSAG